jgi:hypothetical protein
LQVEHQGIKFAKEPFLELNPISWDGRESLAKPWISSTLHQILCTQISSTLLNRAKFELSISQSGMRVHLCRRRRRQYMEQMNIEESELDDFPRFDHFVLTHNFTSPSNEYNCRSNDSILSTPARQRNRYFQKQEWTFFAYFGSCKLSSS